MIVGFSRYGQGSARGAIQYFTSEKNPDGTARTPAPEVLRGDPALIGQLIDALAFKHTYTSGVLSFAPGEVITPETEERIMDEFERIAFAGLDNDQYAILWVRHAHAGHEELNFLIPRVELSTGKSLNIAPPGKASRALFDTFRSMINAEYGLADPEDPERSQDVSLPHHLAKLRADDTRKGKQRTENIRELITTHVRREVDAGRIKDRDGVVAFLEAQGFTLPRKAGEEYITVIPPDSEERIRLKGGLYSQVNFDPGQSAGAIRYGVPDPARAAELRQKLDGLAASRARYHRQRYRNHPEYARDRTPAEGEGLENYLQRQLGDQAILPGDDGGAPARSTQRRRQRQRMEQSIEAIEREIVEGPSRGAADRQRDVSTMQNWLDPNWWEEFYGEEMEP